MRLFHDLAIRCKSPRSFRPRLRNTLPLATVAAALCLFAAGGAFLSAQTQNTTAVSLDASRIIPFLNQTLSWYRQMIADQQLASDANEQVLVADSRQIADQVVRSAFDFARAEAETVNSSLKQAPPQGGAPSQEQTMLSAEQRMDQQIADLQSELSSLNAQLPAAVGKQRQLLQAQITETQSEIDLAKTRKSAIQSMVTFVNGIGTPGDNTGLLGQIDAMAASVPSLTSAPAMQRHQNAPPNAPKDQPNAQSNTNTEAAGTQPAGIWELGAELFGIAQKLRTIDTAINQTDALAKTAADLRTPLSVRLRQLSKQSDQLANTPSSKDPATIAQQRQQADSIAAEYKQLAAIAVPLSKVSILVGLFGKGLENWHAEVRGDVSGQSETAARASRGTGHFHWVGAGIRGNRQANHLSLRSRASPPLSIFIAAQNRHGGSDRGHRGPGVRQPSRIRCDDRAARSPHGRCRGSSAERDCGRGRLLLFNRAIWHPRRRSRAN